MKRGAFQCGCLNYLVVFSTCLLRLIPLKILRKMVGIGAGFFWVTAFTIALCGSALLLTNGHPVLGALGIAGVIIAGFVLLIRRILINDKLAHKKREEEMQKIQAEQSGD